VRPGAAAVSLVPLEPPDQLDGLGLERLSLDRHRERDDRVDFRGAIKRGDGGVVGSQTGDGAASPAPREPPPQPKRVHLPGAKGAITRPVARPEIFEPVVRVVQIEWLPWRNPLAAPRAIRGAGRDPSSPHRTKPLVLRAITSRGRLSCLHRGGSCQEGVCRMTCRRIRRVGPGSSSSLLRSPYQFGMRSASRRRRVSSRQRASSGEGLRSSTRSSRSRSRSRSARQALQTRRPAENSSFRFRLPHDSQTFVPSGSVSIGQAVRRGEKWRLRAESRTPT
jgi:hypothetical protein